MPPFKFRTALWNSTPAKYNITLYRGSNQAFLYGEINKSAPAKYKVAANKKMGVQAVVLKKNISKARAWHKGCPMPSGLYES